ncbi:hypothetical protein JXR93_06255 [bacterium]|nr:hypothetical protein [bacterium]
MNLIQDIKNSTISDCPYSFNEKFRQKYFFAYNLTKKEMGTLIRAGWRRFGIFFFMPICPKCSRCTPIRVDAVNLTLSKTQKKIVKKNRETIFSIKESNEYTQEELEAIFDIYKEHNLFRFNKESTKSDFLESFFKGNQSFLISSYKIADELVAFGFLDILDDGLSSIYFCYKERFANYSLGYFSIITESNYIKLNNMKYYYLGYYIEENHFMSYKNRFLPHQLFSWEQSLWI